MKMNFGNALLALNILGCLVSWPILIANLITPLPVGLVYVAWAGVYLVALSSGTSIIYRLLKERDL